MNLPTVPTLTGQVKKDAQNALLKQGIAYETVGKGSKIVRQYPEAGVKMKPGQRIYLLTEDSANMTIPDFTGVSLRDTLQVLTLMKVGVQVSGEGYVVSQKAQMVNGKRIVSVTLQPAKETVTGVKPEETQDSTNGVAANQTGSATKTEVDTKPNPVLLLMLEQTRELLREEYLLLQMRKVLLRLKARITDSLF